MAELSRAFVIGRIGLTRCRGCTTVQHYIKRVTVTCWRCGKKLVA